MENFRHFWFNVEGITLASLEVEPKLRQRASIHKKQRKCNEMGYLKCVLRLDINSIVLALGVKMYWGQALFFKPYVFIQ